MSYNYWFVSRQKRQLTTILDALIVFDDLCVGKVWSGNRELQLQFEDVLGQRDVTKHGKLRARREGEGGGGGRTLFKQMKDLGLVFLEDDTKKARLTLIGEDLVNGKISLVEAMRIQLGRYQYPSAAEWSGIGSVNHIFNVHPFRFMLRLLRCPELENRLMMSEMAGIVIHYAVSDDESCLNDVKERILRYRNNDLHGYVPDSRTATYFNIANTFFNYISMLQFTDRGPQMISIRAGKEQEVDAFVRVPPIFITHPELQENYQRKYGRGKHSKDLRDFSDAEKTSRLLSLKRRIRNEYAILKMQTPILSITPEIVEDISMKTGIGPNLVSTTLNGCFSAGAVDDFFLNYRELSEGGAQTAVQFEQATCEMFEKIFGLRTEHVGPKGNTPDVFVESDAGWCGIIDNKAYKHRYSLIGDQKRRMIDVYIPNYKEYGNTNRSLAFFAYIAPDFSNHINYQLNEIVSQTGVCGSAMPVNLMINFAQDYAHGKHDQSKILEVFSVNRLVLPSDIA